MDKTNSAIRSKLMARIRSKGNKSTEIRLQMAMVAAKITGWKQQAINLPGKPDFIFPDLKMAIFVDGCFWHSCPKCGHIPHSNEDYWKAKLTRTTKRDKLNRSELRNNGWLVIRIWEHELCVPGRAIHIIKCAIKKQRHKYLD
jgi:DNA mismatch endonuclease, patch repair protein